MILLPSAGEMFPYEELYDKCVPLDDAGYYCIVLLVCVCVGVLDICFKHPPKPRGRCVVCCRQQQQSVTTLLQVRCLAAPVINVSHYPRVPGRSRSSALLLLLSLHSVLTLAHSQTPLPAKDNI